MGAPTVVARKRPGYNRLEPLGLETSLTDYLELLNWRRRVAELRRRPLENRLSIPIRAGERAPAAV